MKPAHAELGRHAPALAAAAVAVTATWLVRDRVAPAVPPVLDDVAVHESVSTAAHDLPPYLTGDLDGDGVPEVMLRVRGAAGPEVAVLARDGTAYEVIGRVPLAGGPAGCPSTFTLEDGALLVTSYARAPWSASGCAPARRAYFRAHDGRLVRVGLVDGDR